MKSWTIPLAALSLLALTVTGAAQAGDEAGPEPSTDAFTRLADAYAKARAKHESAMARLTEELGAAASDQARQLAQSALDHELEAYLGGLAAIVKKLDILDPPPPVEPGAAAKQPETEPAAPEPAAAERARQLTEKLDARIKKMKAERGGKGHGKPGGVAAPGKSDDAGKEGAPGQQKKEEGNKSATGKGQR